MNKTYIKESLRKYLNTNILLEGWFHGTYDSREIEKEGGFTNKTIRVEYVNNPKALDKLQEKMNKAKISGDEELYFSLLNKVSNFKDYYSYNKPLFITDKYSVAKTYADAKRAFDYQNAIEKVYEVDVDCDKIVKIIAIGDRFSYISLDKVKNGFINAGISEERIDELISMFNYYYNDKGIKTDVIGAIGNILNFDCIDVIGVLDSYHGGTIKSTVRMVLDPSKVKIKTKQNLNENIILTEELKTLYHGNKSGYKLDNISFDNNNYFYLTPIFRYALMYAKGNEDGVTGLKIDTSKLLDLRSLGTNKIDSKTFYKETKQYFPSKLLTKNQNNSLWELIRLDFDGDIKKTFQSRGYDGLIIIEQKDGEKFESYVLFNSNPIIDILNTNITESLKKYLVENKQENIFGHRLDVLLDIIGDKVDNPKKFIKNKIYDLKTIQKQSSIILYRVVYIKNPDKLNKNNFGHHYVLSTEDFHEEMLDYLYQNARKLDKNLEEDDVYLIEVETPTSNIDYYETMRTFVLHPWENEITIKDDTKVKLKNITNFFG